MLKLLFDTARGGGVLWGATIGYRRASELVPCTAQRPTVALSQTARRSVSIVKSALSILCASVPLCMSPHVE